MTSLRDSAARGVLWSAVQMWFVRATAAAAFIVLGRQLDPFDFGLVALAAAVISVLATLSDSGLATYLVRSEELTPRRVSTAFWTSLLISVGLAGVLLAVATPIAHGYDEPDLVPVLRWLSLSLVLTGLVSVPTALLRRDLKFKQLAIRSSLAVSVAAVVAIVLALMGAGVWALVAQTLVSGTVTLVVVWSAARWRPVFAWDRREAGTMLKFGVQLLGIDLLSQARSRGQDFMIAAFTSTAGLGKWSVATRLLSIILDTGTSVINSVATPVFAKLQASKERLFAAYEMSLASASAIVLPMMFTMGVVSPVLVPTVLGQQWASVATIAQILSYSAAVSSLSYFDRPVFIALDKVRVEFVLVTISVVTQLAVVAVFTRHGLTVLATALLVRNVVNVALRVVCIHMVTGMPYRHVLPALRVLAAAAAAAGVVAGVMHLLDLANPWLYLMVASLVVLVAYAVFLFLAARPVVNRLAEELRRTLRKRSRADVPGPGGQSAVGVQVPAEEAPAVDDVRAAGSLRSTGR